MVEVCQSQGSGFGRRDGQIKMLQRSGVYFARRGKHKTLKLRVFPREIDHVQKHRDVVRQYGVRPFQHIRHADDRREVVNMMVVSA